MGKVRNTRKGKLNIQPHLDIENDTIAHKYMLCNANYCGVF